MNDLYQEAGGRPGQGMAVKESTQIDYSTNKNDGEYWNDVHNELSPVRKHLIHTYLQIQDEEALPLLGEYFGVALSFMAMGALVRASNSSKKRRKSMSDEERLDLRACSRFQRMALESMLREAMERLRGLAQNAYQMEERVRDLVEAEMENNKEKVVFLSRVAEAEKAVHELKGLRKAEGKANERVMSIVAAKEQDWLKEKRNLHKEIERLKENLNTVCREVKFQSRRCRNPTCEHCKGVERVVRNVRGRASLRELNSREASAHVSSRREVVKVEQPPPEVEEVEEERVLVKALEQKKKRSERPGHLQVQDKVDEPEKPVNWTASRSSVNPSGGSAGGAGQFMTKDLIARQQQDMESELANILKRVGMLKQRSNSSSVTNSGQQNASPESTNVATPSEPAAPLENCTFSVDVEAEKVFSDEAVSEPTTVEAVKVEQSPSMFVSGPELELADDLTTGILTLEQEALLSVEEDPDLLELEKAFEFEASLGAAETTNNFTNDSGDGNPGSEKNIAEVKTAETTEAAQISVNVDTEYSEFESYLSSDEGVANLEKLSREMVSLEDTESEEVNTFVSSASDSNSGEVLINARAEATEILESEVELAFSSILETTATLGNADQVLSTTEDAPVSELSWTTSMTGAVIVMDRSVVDVVQGAPEQCQMQETPVEVGNFEQTHSSTDAVGAARSCFGDEQSAPQDGLVETIMETSLQNNQGSPADSNDVQIPSEISPDEVVDGEDPLELEVAHDDGSDAMDEVHVSLMDEGKSLAEEVKVVDAGASSEPEQILEMVEVDSVTGLPEQEGTPLEFAENVESSATETDLDGHDEDGATTGDKSDLEAEIPVFERAGSEDLAGDLPEPDEKRVCDFSESEVDVVGDDGTANKSPVECEEENKKADDLVTPGDCEIPVVSESVAVPLQPSSDLLEKVNGAKYKSSHELENSAVEVDSAVGAE